MTDDQGLRRALWHSRYPYAHQPKVSDETSPIVDVRGPVRGDDRLRLFFAGPADRARRGAVRPGSFIRFESLGILTDSVQAGAQAEPVCRAIGLLLHEALIQGCCPGPVPGLICSVGRRGRGPRVGPALASRGQRNR